MRINDLFNSFIVVAALSASACDGVDDPEARDRMLAGDLEDADDADDADLDLKAADDEPDRDDRTAKPTPEDDSPALPELPLADENDPAAGPPGTVCCANCGADNWDIYYNLGTGDNCNARGWDYCASHFGGVLINAEWFPPSYCY